MEGSGGRGVEERSFRLLPGILASAVLSAQDTPDLELTFHPKPIAKAGGQVGSEKGEGSEPGADQGSARRGNNCSHYSELRPKPGLPPGLGAVAKWMEMDGGAPSPRRRVRPGAITVPPGWTHCLPP